MTLITTLIKRKSWFYDTGPTLNERLWNLFGGCYFSNFNVSFYDWTQKLDELASAGTLDVRCVMIFMLEKKNTRWVVLGNGDVPLDEVAFFYDWIDYINSVSRKMWHFFRDFKGRKIDLSRDVEMIRIKCTRIFVLLFRR